MKTIPGTLILILFLSACKNPKDSDKSNSFEKFYSFLFKYPGGKIQVVDSSILTYSYIDTVNEDTIYSYYFDRNGVLSKCLYFCVYENEVVYSAKFQNEKIVEESGHPIYLHYDDYSKVKDTIGLFIYAVRLNGYDSKLQIFENNYSELVSIADEHKVTKFVTYFELNKKNYSQSQNFCLVLNRTSQDSSQYFFSTDTLFFSLKESNYFNLIFCTYKNKIY